MGLRGLKQIEQRSIDAKTPDEKAVIDQHRFRAASILSVLKTDQAQKHFLARLDNAEHQLEAAGYLSAHLADQSVLTLKKLMKVDRIQPHLQTSIRMELLNRNDSETIAEVLVRMEARYSELIGAFRNAHQNGWNYEAFNGWLCYIEPDIDSLRSLQQSVTRGIELMEPANPPRQRATGAIMVYTAARTLITDEVAQSLDNMKNDSDPLVNNVANAILKAISAR